MYQDASMLTFIPFVVWWIRIHYPGTYSPNIVISRYPLINLYKGESI